MAEARAGVASGGPLAGVRVLDLSDSSGRLAGKLLAEMGADVVRLRAGEPGPAMRSVPGGLLDWWYDGGTTLLPLDLDADAGRRALRQLVRAADVLIETEAPGRLASLDLGQDRLAAENPRLVHVSLSPFGADGPRAGWQSTDLVMAAAGGILSVNGYPDEPVTIYGRQMDGTAGFYAALCALAGLRRARATGRGTWIDLSQQQAVVSCSEHLLMFWWWPEVLAPLGAPVASRQGALHWIRAYDVVPCKTGYCMVSPSAGGVPQLIEWMTERGHPPALPDDPALAGTPDAVAAFMSAIRSFALELDAHEVFLGGQARHVPFGEVVAIPDVAVNPQHQARGFLRPVEVDGGPVTVPGPLARFSATPCPPPQPPPVASVSPGSSEQEVLSRWASSAGDDGTDGGDDLRLGVPPAGSADGPAGDPAAPPLAGLRVIDFTHVLAGPFGTRVLADLGADVIRVQTESRAQGAHANDFPYSTMWARSKRSITLNMQHEGSVKVLRELVEQADVVIENFSAGVLDGWGAGWSELSAWNPRLIYVSMQGAGTDGPWRDYVTFAPTVHALCGLTALSGPEGRVDCGTGVAVNDHTSGLAAAVCVLAAIEARERTGRGQHIDLSQFEVGTYLVGPALVDWMANGREAKAAGTRDAFTDPVPNDVVRTRDDRWLAVTARDDADWARLAPVLGSPDGLTTVEDRRRRRDEVRALLTAWAAARSADDAADALQAAGVPASAVQDASTLTQTDPQLRHRDWVVTVDSPLWGTQSIDRFPAVLHDADGTEVEIEYRHSPYLGEHNFEAYGELLGLDPDVIAEHMGEGLFS